MSHEELDELDVRPVPVPVRVAPLARRTTHAPLEVEGRFAASRAVLIKSPASGLLEGPALSLGDTVREGQWLASIGEAMAKQRALATDAALCQLEAAVAEREEALDLARARGEADERALIAKLRQAEHKLAHEKVQSERNALALASLRVHAPFDARVAAVHVSPGASVMSGNPLMELVEVDPIVLVIEVPTFVASRCREGFEVEVRANADPRPLVGRVSRGAPTAADDVRRLLVEVDNAGGRLAAGERGRALLDLGERDAFFAPRVALRHEKNATHLQLVEHDKVLVRRVRTFGGDDREVEVAGRLESTFLVVLDAERPLKEETEVVIRGDH